MNHPSDTPDTCCPTCLGEGEILPESVAQEKADAQALADVRTLDALWRPDSFGTYRLPVMSLPDAEGVCTTLVGTGPTPDAARRAAAELVRGHKA